MQVVLKCSVVMQQGQVQLWKERARTYHVIQFDPISKAQLLEFIVTCKAYRETSCWARWMH